MTKPVLFSEDYVATRFDPRSRTAQDPSRIEGWSETVRANDIAKADDLRFREAHVDGTVIKTKEDAYKVIGAKPAELPVEFVWLRVNGPGGAHSASAAVEIDSYTADKGFVLCTRDKFTALEEAYGYKFNHASWRVAEDGMIRRGADVALFFRSGEVAKMWEQYRVEDNARLENQSVPATLSAAGETVETFSEDETETVFIHH